MADPPAVVAQLIFGIVRGLLLGCVFALIAHGLNLIWGIAKVVNVAHGEFIMLGAYGAYFLNLFLGFNPLVSAPIDAALGLGVGLGFYFVFLHRELRGKEAITLQSEMVTLVATFGLSLFIANAANVLFSGNFVGIPWNADPWNSASSRFHSGGFTSPSCRSRSSPLPRSSSTGRTWALGSERTAKTFPRPS